MEYSSKIRLNCFSSLGMDDFVRSVWRRLVHVCGDANDDDVDDPSFSCDLALDIPCCILTIGINVSIVPVFERSAPLLLGRLSAFAIDGIIMRYDAPMALWRISLRVVVSAPVYCSLFTLDACITIVLECFDEDKGLPSTSPTTDEGGEGSTNAQHAALVLKSTEQHRMASVDPLILFTIWIANSNLATSKHKCSLCVAPCY